mmetsp:Transcript_81224/g.197197  ORF Transcript_81224/g.197197 Transcript_81224/m.197197 type:complete len:333 (+) Transcript_81224:564-1562(+)
MSASERPVEDLRVRVREPDEALGADQAPHGRSGLGRRVVCILVLLHQRLAQRQILQPYGELTDDAHEPVRVEGTAALVAEGGDAEALGLTRLVHVAVAVRLAGLAAAAVLVLCVRAVWLALRLGVGVAVRMHLRVAVGLRSAGRRRAGIGLGGGVRVLGVAVRRGLGLDHLHHAAVLHVLVHLGDAAARGGGQHLSQVDTPALARVHLRRRVECGDSLAQEGQLVGFHEISLVEDEDVGALDLLAHEIHHLPSAVDEIARAEVWPVLQLVPLLKLLQEGRAVDNGDHGVQLGALQELWLRDERVAEVVAHLSRLGHARRLDHDVVPWSTPLT